MTDCPMHFFVTMPCKHTTNSSLTSFLQSLYSCAAMLARVLAMALCPHLSLTSQCFIETDGRNNLAFGMGASFNQFYTVF